MGSMKVKKLFQSVIILAFRDAVNASKSAQLHCRDARFWLTRDGADIRFVSSAAGLAHEKVIESAMKLEALGWPPEGLPKITEYFKRV